jgi:hypothetical protein
MMLPLASGDSFAAVLPLTIKVTMNNQGDSINTNNSVTLVSNNYSDCQWFSSAPTNLALSSSSGKSVTGISLSPSVYTWIVVTCTCQYGGGKTISECLEFTISEYSNNISQGFSNMSRGDCGPCQYGSLD